ncbi:unnamed protein product [Rotaria socialis]|uniref:Meckelin n=1 Tax=Rotaria socialis TaxID=392032 RepID=A0A820KCF0_9BILA|nr:unnamed protein product [Rotaria socialis]CAF3450750.1 unnamed protein product [Rotaria socialis]CAF4337769.1 unnamed protein product [Rotaria socialis]
MDAASQNGNALIAFGALSGAGIILAFARTWKWFSRSGRDVIDLATIGKFFAYICGIIGTVLLLVTAGVSIWYLIFIKNIPEITDTNKEQIKNLLETFLITSFVLKLVDIIHIIIRQTRIEIFFMDWERPKKGDSENVSVWRTYFAANELNEIQTFRRVNVPFQLLFVLFFLKVINFESYSCGDGTFISSLSNFNCLRSDAIVRIAVAFFVLLGTAVVQNLFFTIFYQRFIEDKITNFIDLCSVSNISVFILDENLHGYYIHGRSPHGMTDVNMKDTVMNLYREENRMSGTRGLEPNSDEQIFIMKINRSFQRQYQSLLRTYYGYTGPRKTRQDAERYTDLLLQAYQNLNGFLCAFIDQSLSSHQYILRNRFFLERILDYEFRVRTRSDFDGQITNFFFTDNEKTFTNILFCGEQSTLVIWNMITFLFIDILAQNYVLAAILTYAIDFIFVGIRNSFGRKNLSKKTLIPKNFLI